MNNRIKLKKLNEVIQLISGRDLPKEYYNSVGKGIPYIMGASNMNNGKLYIERWTEKPSVIGYKDDIVISVKGTIGELLILSEKEVHLSRQVMSIRVSENVSIKYMYYYLKFYLSKIQEKAKGMIPGVTREDILSADFVYTDSILQDKIVEILDKSQELIDKRKTQIDALDELVKSQFIEMFGDPIINSKKLPMRPLGEICNMKAGKSIKANDISEFFEDGMYPCYGGNGLRGYVRSYTHEGTIPLIGRQGALCGNAQYAKGKFYATEHAVVTQPKVPMDTCWLYIMLREMNLNRLATGAAQPGLNVSTLVPIEVIMPSIESQKEFSKFVEQVDKLKFEMQKSLQEMENNFNSLMQRAFK